MGCYIHTNVNSNGKCERCGKELCANCLSLFNNQNICIYCYEKEVEQSVDYFRRNKDLVALFTAFILLGIAATIGIFFSINNLLVSILFGSFLTGIPFFAIEFLSFKSAPTYIVSKDCSLIENKSANFGIKLLIAFIYSIFGFVYIGYKLLYSIINIIKSKNAIKNYYNELRLIDNFKRNI